MFWQDFKLAYYLQESSIKEKEKISYTPTKEEFMMKDAMLNVLKFELDKIQLLLLKDQVILVDGQIRPLRESYEKNDINAL